MCLVVAHKMFADEGNHHDACVTLYRLNHFKALVDYARETAEFTKSEISMKNDVIILNIVFIPQQHCL